MTKNTLKKFAELSYNKNLIDEHTVEKVTSKLSRNDLKVFIRFLHAEEKKREVYVTSSESLTTQNKASLQKQFGNKNVVFATDPSMISGIKVVENDEEYEINLNQTFHDIMRFLSTK